LLLQEAELRDLELVDHLLLGGLGRRLLARMAVVAGTHERWILKVSQPQDGEIAQVQTLLRIGDDRALAREVVLGDTVVTLTLNLKFELSVLE